MLLKVYVFFPKCILVYQRKKQTVPLLNIDLEDRSHIAGSQAKRNLLSDNPKAYSRRFDRSLFQRKRQQNKPVKVVLYYREYLWGMSDHLLANIWYRRRTPMTLVNS
jgi:hypothetical protein